MKKNINRVLLISIFFIPMLTYSCMPPTLAVPHAKLKSLVSKEQLPLPSLVQENIVESHIDQGTITFREKITSIINDCTSLQQALKTLAVDENQDIIMINLANAGRTLKIYDKLIIDLLNIKQQLKMANIKKPKQTIKAIEEYILAIQDPLDIIEKTLNHFQGEFYRITMEDTIALKKLIQQIVSKSVDSKELPELKIKVTNLHEKLIGDFTILKQIVPNFRPSLEKLEKRIAALFKY